MRLFLLELLGAAQSGDTAQCPWGPTSAVMQGEGGIRGWWGLQPTGAHGPEGQAPHALALTFPHLITLTLCLPISIQPL